MSSIDLIGISGSLRSGSFNTQLLEVAQRHLPDGARLSIEKLDDFPLFNQDKESPPPVAVGAVKSALRNCDGVIICTPEYNLGMPGVLKNAFDWLSRPPQEQPQVLHGKPVLLLGASPGPFGTISAQNASLSMFRALRMPVWNEQGMFAVTHAGDRFKDGKLTDEALEHRLRQQVEGFCRHLEQLKTRSGA